MSLFSKPYFNSFAYLILVYDLFWIQKSYSLVGCGHICRSCENIYNRKINFLYFLATCFRSDLMVRSAFHNLLVSTSIFRLLFVPSIFEANLIIFFGHSTMMIWKYLFKEYVRDIMRTFSSKAIHLLHLSWYSVDWILNIFQIYFYHHRLIARAIEFWNKYNIRKSENQCRMLHCFIILAVFEGKILRTSKCE